MKRYKSRTQRPPHWPGGTDIIHTVMHQILKKWFSTQKLVRSEQINRQRVETMLWPAQLHNASQSKFWQILVLVEPLCYCDLITWNHRRIQSVQAWAWKPGGDWQFWDLEVVFLTYDIVTAYRNWKWKSKVSSGLSVITAVYFLTHQSVSSLTTVC